MKAELVERMNKLPEVRWDRCAGDDNHMAVYGWIARDDGRSDFIVLQAVEGEDQEFASWFVTSSAEHSREFDIRLRGTDEGHGDCLRVEDVFGDAVANKVVLA